jgi:hypothetical protein
MQIFESRRAITDEGVEAATSLAANLSILDVRHCPQVSPKSWFHKWLLVLTWILPPGKFQIMVSKSNSKLETLDPGLCAMRLSPSLSEEPLFRRESQSTSLGPQPSTPCPLNTMPLIVFIGGPAPARRGASVEGGFSDRGPSQECARRRHDRSRV